MAKKIRDLAVKTGEYRDSQTGQTKGRWLNIGAMFKNDDGGEFILLESWFNPAGVPRGDGKSSVLLSLFRNDQNGQGQPPQDYGQPPQGYGQPPQGTAQQPPRQGQAAPSPYAGNPRGSQQGYNDSFSDEIPFD